jgi:hypothetical protein
MEYSLSQFCSFSTLFCFDSFSVDSRLLFSKDDLVLVKNLIYENGMELDEKLVFFSSFLR